MSDITSASREQNSGIEQINQAVTQMDDVTQQNAALVEQAAAAAASLEQQANELVGAISIFHLSRSDAKKSQSVTRLANKKNATFAGLDENNTVQADSTKLPKRKKVAAGGSHNQWSEF
jgi:aerotaxis receptor